MEAKLGNFECMANKLLERNLGHLLTFRKLDSDVVRPWISLMPGAHIGLVLMHTCSNSYYW